MANGPLTLNGFDIELPAEFDVVVRAMPSPADVKAERERLGEHWFVHWLGNAGTLYGDRSTIP